MESRMGNIRILAVPCGQFNPYQHENAFSPYESSPDVWVIQVKTEENSLVKWKSIPIVRLDNIEG